MATARKQRKAPAARKDTAQPVSERSTERTDAQASKELADKALSEIDDALKQPEKKTAYLSGVYTGGTPDTIICYCGVTGCQLGPFVKAR